MKGVGTPTGMWFIGGWDTSTRFGGAGEAVGPGVGGCGGAGGAVRGILVLGGLPLPPQHIPGVAQKLGRSFLRFL